jgi:lipoprotein-anchoring transpeptidase ErfK/SrfK
LQNFKGRVALVNLRNQTLKICDNRINIVETPISTGKPTNPTPQGNFRIDSARTNTRLIGSDYNVFVNNFNTIGGLDINGRNAKGREIGIHDASWRKEFGIPNGYGKSHGCINIPPRIAKRVIENIPIGTRVAIFNNQTAKRILTPLIKKEKNLGQNQTAKTLF